MIGPDAARYLHMGRGGDVPRPFHLRWLLPKVCRSDIRRWWAAWVAAWAIAAGSMFALCVSHGWQVATAATVLLLGLPGILGPSAVIPVGVDLPATAMTLAAVAVGSHCWPVAVLLLVVAASIKETAPVFAALWVWAWWPLPVLLLPLFVHLTTTAGPDPLGAKFQAIADHPIRSAVAARSGRWRDGWLMVAPWGVCLLALGRPSWPLAAVLAAAYLQLVVATDTVRLVHHAAGPVLALGAATVTPTHLLPALAVAGIIWWRTPERI